VQKQAEQAVNAARASQSQGPQTPPARQSDGTGTQDGTPDSTVDLARQPPPSADDSAQQTHMLRGNPNGTRPEAKPKHASQGYEVAEEVGQIMKTAFPLLIMSLETISDQLFLKFKSSNEEETYRLISMLMQEALTVRFFTYLNISSLSYP
jgi:transformation/transcription domain-associated protein